MKLGVVILNWNDAAGSADCLRGVLAWDAPAPVVVVVDNASRDGSADAIAAAFPGIECVRSETNRGFAGGNNLGIRRALDLGCEAVLLLNSDARIDEKDVAVLLGLLARHGGNAIVGPAIEEATSAGRVMTYGGRDMARHHHTRITRRPAAADGEGATVHAVAYVPGTVLLTTARVFETVGPLFEPFFFSGEIADFCASARARGIPCLVDSSIRARHGHAGAQPLRNTLYLYYSLRNRFLYVDRQGGRAGPLLRCLWVGGALLMIGLAALRLNGARARAAAWALADGWRGNWGDRNDRFGV